MRRLFVTFVCLMVLSVAFAETKKYVIENTTGSETNFFYDKYKKIDNSSILIEERNDADGKLRSMSIFWNYNDIGDCILTTSVKSKHNHWLSDDNKIQEMMYYTDSQRVLEKKYIAYSPVDKITTEVSIGIYKTSLSGSVLIMTKDVYRNGKKTSTKFIDAEINNMQVLTLLLYFDIDLAELTTPR